MDLNDALRRLEAAKGDANALALATVDIVLASHDPAVTRTLEAAAVPHWFHARMLRALLDGEVPGTPDWFDQILRLTVVERFHAHDAWNVHEVTRLALRKRLATEHPDRFRVLSARAASLVEGDAAVQAMERVYHLLSSEPEEGAHQLRRLWKDWSGVARLQPLQALGKALDELCGQHLLTPRARGYALIVLGWIRENRIELRAWTAMAQEAVDLMTRVRDEIGLVDAYSFLGKALKAHGRLSDALAAYEKAREHLEHRLTSNPGDPELNDERADLHEGIGRTLEDGGRLHEALREYERAREIRLRLYDTQSDDERHRVRLAVAYTDVGDSLAPTGRAAEAEALYVQALHLLETLPDQRLATESTEQNIGRLQGRIGDSFVRRGDSDGGLKRYDAALNTFLRLVERDPEHFAWKYDVAQVHISIAHVHLTRRQFDAADEHYSHARSILADLAERDPANPFWKRNLGVLCSSFGVLREEQGRTTDAVSEYMQSDQLLRELSDIDPDRADWKASLASVQNHLTGFMTRIAAALDDDEQKVQVLTIMLSKVNAARVTFGELVELDPGNINWRGNLAWSDRLLAAAIESVAQAHNAGLKIETEMSPTGMWELALHGYMSSISTVAQLIQEDPENASYKYDLCVSASRAARVLELLGRREEALDMYRGALTRAEQLVALDATNTNWAGEVTSIRGAMSRVGAPDSPIEDLKGTTNR